MNSLKVMYRHTNVKLFFAHWCLNCLYLPTMITYIPKINKLNIEKYKIIHMNK